MFPKPVAYCPVGDHVRLGIITRGEVCSFVCEECKFIFTWDKNGKLTPPVKLEKKPKSCNCLGCQGRDEQKYYKREL